MKFLPLYNANFTKLLEDFKRAIQTQGYSRGKDCAYPNHVREFLFFIETKHISDIKTVKVGEVIAYLEYLSQRPNIRRGGGLSEAAIREHRYSLRLFFDYLLTTKQIESSPARFSKFQVGSSNDMRVLTVEEIKQLYAVCRNRLERAILSLAYGCGLRRSEIESLDVNDVLFSKGIVNVRKGKGNKPRTVPATDKVIQDLRGYVVYERDKRARPGTLCHAFFLNKYGERMQGWALNWYLQQMVKRTGNTSILCKAVTLHTLRRSISVHLMNNGADMDFVRRFLGHVMLDTTHLYSRRRKQRIKPYDALNGIRST
jgi:integrase/recombinase XerD